MRIAIALLVPLLAAACESERPLRPLDLPAYTHVPTPAAEPAAGGAAVELGTGKAGAVLPLASPTPPLQELSTQPSLIERLRIEQRQRELDLERERLERLHMRGGLDATGLRTLNEKRGEAEANRRLLDR